MNKPKDDKKSVKPGCLLISALVLSSLLLTSCHKMVEEQPELISVYATFYPMYALADAVFTDIPDAELHCLVQPQDGCLRNYALSDWDVYLLANADAVIMAGRGLESFENVLTSSGENGPAVSAVLYNLELYNQKQTEVRDGETHLAGANPHLFMSLNGAVQIIESISATMMSMDPAYASKYSDNAQSAITRLQSLYEESRNMLDVYSGCSVILMNECLVYVAQDYGLETALWYDRESGTGLYDTQLQSFLEQAEASGSRIILIEQQAPQELVDALTDAGFSVALIDIMSTHSESDGFETYIDAQLKNAQTLNRAFAQAAALITASD